MIQLLDQVNRTLHLRYKNSKHELFTTARNINREGSMHILAKMWNGWVSKQSLLKAAKRIGDTVTGLNVNFMQTEKFEQAAGIPEGNNTNEVPETPHAYHLKTSGRILHCCVITSERQEEFCTVLEIKIHVGTSSR